MKNLEQEIRERLAIAILKENKLPISTKGGKILFEGDLSISLYKKYFPNEEDFNDFALLYLILKKYKMNNLAKLIDIVLKPREILKKEKEQTIQKQEFSKAAKIKDIEKQLPTDLLTKVEKLINSELTKIKILE